jgi:hypothetical protein
VAHCDFIERRLNAMIELRVEVVQELHTPNLPPERRAELIQELRQLGQAIANARRQLQQCQAADLPRPDLVASDFVVTQRGQSLSVAGRIVNRGDAAATGPFQVTLGVTFTAANGEGQTRQLNVTVPRTTTIEGFGTSFVTEPLTDIPIVNGVYTLEMIVDAEREVSESLESNNYLQQAFRVRLGSSVAAS